MDPSILAESLRFSYGKKLAVDGVSFSVQAGEVLGILGPNGAGKSTTIKMLTGQLLPDQGTVRIKGREIRGHDPATHARMGVSFEEKNLYLELSAGENLRFFARLFGLRRPDVAGLLERVDLGGRERERGSSFSKGMRQRLMIARALVNDPDIIILDEPTDGLDPVSAKAIREVIREQARKGAAIILTTHDMNEADKLSDRVAFINEGRVHALDTPDNLKLAYGRRSIRVKTARGDAVSETSVVISDDGLLGERLKAAVESGEVLTLHSEEATLEDIFIAITGRGL